MEWATHRSAGEASPARAMNHRRFVSGAAYAGFSRSISVPAASRVSFPPLERRIEVVEGGCALPPHLRGAVIALGNFDGLHQGHQAVVGRAVEMAQSRGVAAIVSTFDPHPTRYFKPDAAPFSLSTAVQRQRWLGDAGADAMMVFRFGGTLANVAPEVFVKQWLASIGGIVTGTNFSFGCRRTGDVRLLAALGSQIGLECDVIEPVAAHGDPVSSSRIRAALRQGDCEMAATLLTRPYTIESVVRPADESQSRWGLPRVSIDFGDYLRPAAGVYRVRVAATLAPFSPTAARLVIADGMAPALLELTNGEHARTISGQAIAMEFLSRID